MSKTDELAQQRALVDDIDAKIIALLGERFAITRRIGTIKAKQNISARDTERETRQMERIAQNAKEANISPELARHLLEAIIDEAVKEHNQIRSEYSI